MGSRYKQDTFAHETFKDVEDNSTLNELHRYLFDKHALLDRVIRARQMHHARFYSLNLDYGHKAYIDKLTNERFVVLRALERLERRTAEVLYKQAKWFKWVRERQDEEESAREKESEKIKKEAKLFRRHWKEAEARLKEKRRREDSKRQEAFLDEVYRERLAQMSEEDEELEGDPIEDAIEDDRTSFVDMMRHLLWLSSAVDRETQHEAATNGKDRSGAGISKGSTGAADKENIDPSGKALTKSAKKRAKAKAKVVNGPKQESSELDDEVGVKLEVNESREDLRNRLINGEKYDHMEGVHGTVLRGTIESPVESTGRIVGMPAEEVDKILAEVSQIKLFLFCRLLLSQAAILPAALKATSVEEFLTDPEIATSDLRDLCLRLEAPSLQEIRDACADFFRGDAAEDLESDDDEEEECEDKETKNLHKFKHKFVPEKWRSKHEQAVERKKQQRRMLEAGDGQTLIDFGAIENGKFKNKVVRVKVCGKNIWNYPSDKAMARGGWLHYAIIAKGSKLSDAIQLCRSWEEFWELNVLSIFQYFPAAHRGQWAGNRARQQMLQLGFIPYLQYDHADMFTIEHISRGPLRRGGDILAMAEQRNVMGAHIKRNDPVSRRFVQYLAMRSHALVLMVRDAKTGRVVVTPPEKECWLERHGTVSMMPEMEDEPDWIVEKSVNEDLFEQISGKKEREWQFGFTDYYDVIVWDLEPGQPFACLYNIIQETLFKAHRFATGLDMYEPMGPIIKTLWRDRKTGRVRDAKPGEPTIYDELSHSRFMFGGLDKGKGDMDLQMPPNLLYNDIDVAEDLILFPEEMQGKMGAVTDRDDAITKRIERHGPNWRRFVNDLDSDQESDDFPDPGIERHRCGDGSRSESLCSNDREGSIDEDEGASQHGADDDSEWLTEYESDDSDDYCHCEHCENGQIERCENPATKHVLFDTGDDDPETLRLALAFEKFEPSSERDPAVDFRFFADRESAKVFKKQWHEAVLDPEERAQHAEGQSLLKELCAPSLPQRDRHFCFNILLWLHVHYHERRLVWRDIEEAFAAMSVFFAFSGGRPALSEDGKSAQACFADNKLRAERLPNRRMSTSNLVLAEEYWQQMNSVHKAMRRERTSYHRDWDKVVRPVVAHFFKAGVINPSYLPDEYTPSITAVLTEPGRQPDVFIDFRRCKSVWPSAEGGTYDGAPIVNPYKEDLLQKARSFASKSTGARFALLRVWSHSHFWPLTCGWNKRDETAFEDTIGRSWEWRFVPKDMPGAEWSMQSNADQRLKRYRSTFGGNLVTKRDMVLIMGTNEEHLKKLAVAATFALQTAPWRWEIDLWKSFVNVDLGFLEGLDKKWLD